MSLFRRIFSPGEVQDTQQSQPADKPIVADEHTVAQVAALMDRFSAAVGEDSLVLAVGRGVSAAAGIPGMGESPTPYGDDFLERPWKMLSVVAQAASKSGRHLLAVKILGFTFFWDRLVVPQYGPKQLVLEALLVDAPPPIEAEIAANGLISGIVLLRQSSPNQVVMGNSAGSVTLGTLLRSAAMIIVEAPGKGIEVEESILEAARETLG